MGFRLKETRMLTLRTSDEVRECAAQLKGYGGTESEREDKAIRKLRIKNKILSEEVTPFRWCIGIVTDPDGPLRRRVNGQHSSEVFLELAPEEWASVRFPVVVIWEEYQCDGRVDLANLFEQFDPQWSSRDGKDIMGAHLGIHENLRSVINRRIALLVATGIVWYRNAVEGQQIPSEAKYQIVHENHDLHHFLSWCGSFLQKGKTEEMHRSSVIASMYMTAKDEAAKGFWKRIAAGKAAHDADSVEYKLAEFLEMCHDSETDWPRSVTRHFKHSAKRPRPGELDVFATCLRAFRSWQKGSKVADIFTPAKDRKASQIAQEFKEVKAVA